MHDNGHQIENLDARRRTPPTPEQRAVSDLAERIINPERPAGNWGIGRFVKRKGWLVLEIEKDDVRHLYVADSAKLEEGLYPFRVDETVTKREADGAILRQVRLHTKMLEATGIYGYVAGLGREKYEDLCQLAEADPLIDAILFKWERRDKFAPKAGQAEWIARISEERIEDWVTISETIADISSVQPDLRWYYRLDPEAPRKRLRRQLAPGRRAGQRYVGELVEPYVADLPEETEAIWSAVTWTLENPPE